jgi:hypothetical protein
VSRGADMKRREFTELVGGSAVWPYKSLGVEIPPTLLARAVLWPAAGGALCGLPCGLPDA